MTDHSPSPLAFCDTETDGIHPSRKIWEVAIVRREPDGTEDAWEAFLDIDLATADPFGLRLSHFYDRHPLGRYLSGQVPVLDLSGVFTHRRAALEVARRTHGAHVVGAVPSFDTDRLDERVRAAGLIPAWHYHLTDVENLAVGYLAALGTVLLPPWTSSDLSDHLGVAMPSDEERHTAMGDVRWAMRLWDKMMGTPA